MAHDENTGELDDLSNREILAIMLNEMADIRKELKGDIATLDAKLTKRIGEVDVKLTERIDEVDVKLTERIDAANDQLAKRIDVLNNRFNTLNMKVDRNHLTFMHHIDSYDNRIAVLEAA